MKTSIICLVIALTILTTSNALFSIEEALSHFRTPLQGDYQEEFRGQFHYSNKINWMGYPCGFVKVGDLFHLYMQISVNSTTQHQFGWGHATSKDLVYWEEQPIAINYDNLTDGNQIWTLCGSSVYDAKNTSGFGYQNPPIVSIYTAQSIYENATKDREEQWIQFADHQGLYFIEYANNPIVEKDSNSFRDPHVSWHEESQKWVMVVAESFNNSVDVYTSSDLKKWTYESTFGPEGFHTSCQWEGPQLVRLAIEGEKDKFSYILAVTVLEGTTDYYNMFVQYFNVDFNGTHIKNLNSADIVKKVDYGSDFYQVKVVHDYEKKGNEIWMGWLDNLNYAIGTPTNDWKGHMTIPREISLRKNQTGGQFDLIQKPWSSLEKLRKGLIPIQNNQNFLSSDSAIFEYHADCFELKVKLRFVSGDVIGVKVYFGTDVGTPQETIIGYDRKKKLVFINRQLSGYIELNRFSTIIDSYYEIEGESIEFHIFVDKASVEVFVDGGIRVLTAQIFPDSTKNGVTGFAPGSLFLVESIRMWHLKSIWGNDE